MSKNDFKLEEEIYSLNTLVAELNEFIKDSTLLTEALLNERDELKDQLVDATDTIADNDSYIEDLMSGLVKAQDSLHKAQDYIEDLPSVVRFIYKQ